MGLKRGGFALLATPRSLAFLQDRQHLPVFFVMLGINFNCSLMPIHALFIVHWQPGLRMNRMEKVHGAIGKRLLPTHDEQPD